MDEKVNARIEELKRNRPSPFLPVLLLLVATVAVFLYRVGTTSPAQETPVQEASGDVLTKPARPTAAAPRPVSPAAANKPLPAAPASEAEAIKAKISDRIPKAGEAAAEPAPASGEAAAQGKDDGKAALEAYLAGHVGLQVPFLYKGDVRSVTLASYTADTVTIKRRKTFTMKRSDLSPEQLELWK